MKVTFAAARTAAIAVVLLGLFVGIAAALNDPIPGIDIVVRKNPGGIPVNVVPDNGGNYQVKGLAPGSYDVCVAKLPCKLVIVGSDGTLKGQVQSPAGPKGTGAGIADQGSTGGLSSYKK